MYGDMVTEVEYGSLYLKCEEMNMTSMLRLL